MRMSHLTRPMGGIHPASGPGPMKSPESFALWAEKLDAAKKAAAAETFERFQGLSAAPGFLSAMTPRALRLVEGSAEARHVAPVWGELEGPEPQEAAAPEAEGPSQAPSELLAWLRLEEAAHAFADVRQQKGGEGDWDRNVLWPFLEGARPSEPYIPDLATAAQAWRSLMEDLSGAFDGWNADLANELGAFLKDRAQEEGGQ